MATGDSGERLQRIRVAAAFRDLSGDGSTVTLRHLADETGLDPAVVGQLFETVADVAVAALIEQFDVVATIDYSARIEQKDLGARVTESSVFRMLEFLDARRATYAEILHVGGPRMHAVEDALTANGLDILRAYGSTVPHPEIQARVMAAGCLGIFRWWLDAEPELTHEELVVAVGEAMPSEFLI